MQSNFIHTPNRLRFQMQQNALEELRRLLAYIQSTTGAAPLDLGSFPAAAKLQQLLNTPHQDQPGSS